MKLPNNPLTLLRGPLIIFSVVSALLGPYLVQLPWPTLGLLLLFVVGLGVTLVDVFVCVSEQVRVLVRNKINTVVLDDVLKSIFDPEGGLLATCTASLIGSSAMYSIASTEDQRVRLLQSGLWVRDPEVARNVLYQPGGIKTLLPSVILEWLEPTSKKKDEVVDMGWTEKCPESSDDESATALYEEGKNSIRYNNENNHAMKVRSDRPMESATCRVQSTTAPCNAVDSSPRLVFGTDPPLPHEVMGAILVENFRDKLAGFWNKLPDPSTVGITASTAALLLVLQLRSSRKARDMLVGCFHSLVTVGLSSVVMTAGAMFFARYNAEDNNKRLSLANVKENVLNHLKRNWKGWLAALFLLYMRQQQQRPRRR